MSRMNEYISREDVLKKAKSSISVPAGNEWDCGYNTAMAEMQEFIKQLPSADVQPIVYAHKTINVGRRSYCSNCGKLAIMEDFCSKCGAKVKDGEPTRNLTDEETEIYESWIDHEAKDAGVNIMDGEQK